MKKFKFIFFMCLIVLASLIIYLDKTDKLSFKIVDIVDAKDDIRQAITLEKTVLNSEMENEKDITTKILNKDENTITFNTTTLNSDNDKYTMNLKLSNNYSDKKIDVGIKCSSTSNYINVYPDKNNYTIDRNEDIEVLIIIQLNKHDISTDISTDFQCEVVSTIE